MEVHRAKIKSWNKFLTRKLIVTLEVLGQIHSFPFENSTVSIKIPNIDQVDRGKDYDQVASVGILGVKSNEALEFDIHKVDVEVFIPITLPVPGDVFARLENAYELFTDAEQQTLDQVAEQYHLVAKDAFEYWLRVIRWVTDNSSIGREKVEGFLSGWTTELVDVERNKAIWAQARGFVSSRHKPLNLNEWQEIQLKLENCLHPPVYITLKHDAEESLRLGDLRRSLLYMAMACETFLRFSVLQKLPDELSTKLVTYIEEANIRQYTDKFFSEIIDEEGNKQFNKLKSDLNKLFDRRNKLVHMGNSDGLDGNVCRKFLKVTQQLLSISVG